VIERQRAWITVATVKDGRDLVRVTQAAARTFALRVTELGDEFESGFHRILQLTTTSHRVRDQYSTTPKK
jgi:hypothetical protein